jgi:hypothetical protein
MALVHTRAWDPSAFAESPWFAWLEPALGEVAQTGGFPGPERWSELHAARACAAEVPALRFVAAPPKKPRRRTRREPLRMAELYEGRIVECGEVPTRLSDWHDFFNALAFLAFPRAKAALHARQYRLIAGRIPPGARRLPGARTREQDALSLLDEGGIVLAVEPAELARLSPDVALQEQQLLELLSAGKARAVPFGHALYEHLVAGIPGMLGTPQLIPLAPQKLERAQIREALDCALALALADPAQFLAPSAARGLALERLLP